MVHNRWSFNNGQWRFTVQGEVVVYNEQQCPTMVHDGWQWISNSILPFPHKPKTRRKHPIARWMWPLCPPPIDRIHSNQAGELVDPHQPQNTTGSHGHGTYLNIATRLEFTNVGHQTDFRCHDSPGITAAPTPQPPALGPTPAAAGNRRTRTSGPHGRHPASCAALVDS